MIDGVGQLDESLYLYRIKNQSSGNFGLHLRILDHVQRAGAYSSITQLAHVSSGDILSGHVMLSISFAMSTWRARSIVGDLDEHAVITQALYRHNCIT